MRSLLALVALVTLLGSDVGANKSLRDARNVAKGKPSRMGATLERLPPGDRVGDPMPGSNTLRVRTPNKDGSTTSRTFVQGRHVLTQVLAGGSGDAVSRLRHTDEVTNGERRISTKKRGQSLRDAKERRAPLGRGR